MQNVTEAPQNQGAVDSALPKEACTYQNFSRLLSYFPFSSGTVSDEVQDKQPVADQDESIEIFKDTFKDTFKDRIARQLQWLKYPKEESLCRYFSGLPQ